jgi:hypothetical protein
MLECTLKITALGNKYGVLFATEKTFLVSVSEHPKTAFMDKVYAS